MVLAPWMQADLTHFGNHEIHRTSCSHQRRFHVSCLSCLVCEVLRLVLLCGSVTSIPMSTNATLGRYMTSASHKVPPGTMTWNTTRNAQNTNSAAVLKLHKFLYATMVFYTWLKDTSFLCGVSNDSRRTDQHLLCNHPCASRSETLHPEIHCTSTSRIKTCERACARVLDD